MATATAKKTAKRTPAKPALEPAPASNHTPSRHLRCDDSIWLPASEQAKRDGYSGGISELIRSLLRDYNAGKRMG